ncbi:MAG: aspartate--tRNA ligase [Enterobacteriaceae bacterium PSpicST2]|nr:MAG: aspartate--tRNA ligase [Enterobacteriaceae bacterium PSpicST2]WMC19119.1 MAG: aspartate--tRNA ligase [Enterobacteriaceae bacterium PSpicST1]
MRTEYCGNLNISHINKNVTLCGWVNKIRNFGNLIFIDIRDCKGIVQIVFNSINKTIFNKALKLRNEFCIQINGIVCKRPFKQINKIIKTGKIEIFCNFLNIINTSKKIPLNFNKKNLEEINLKYRYLELRKPEMIKRFKIRSKICNYIRNYLNKNNFIEIETPILTKSTPEGARDFLVPSRINKGKFYALPQSPQIFKQLLMISGFDRYYQIIKCFRDEDLRSDRQPEFTQIDIETSFLNSKKLIKLMEKMICNLFLKINKINISKFKIITFSEALRRYGSDKPDLRNPIELIDLKDIFIKTNLLKYLPKKFYNNNNSIIGLKIPNIKNKNVIKILNYNKIINNNNLLWFKIYNISKNLNGIKGNALKFLNKKILELIFKRTKSKNGDIIIIGSNNNKNIYNIMGNLRKKIGNILNLINLNDWSTLWVINFPLFKKDKNNKINSKHNPFSNPYINNIDNLINNPISFYSNSYDMIINGHEIGGGSVRINNRKIQKKIFDILNIKKYNIKNLNFLLDAFKYGVPYHAGIAFGLDRLVMLLTNTKNIRDVIAFPKTTSAKCLMTNAPSKIELNILKELFNK